MAVLSIILGVFLIIAGISFIATPLATFLATGFILAIFLFVYGIAGIVKAIQGKAHVLEVVCSVLAIIVGIVAIIRPGGTLAFDTIILYFLAAWLFVVGVTSIIIAFQSRPSNGWYWGLISGILAVILGILAFIYPMFSAITVGILIGFFCIFGGISLISLAFTTNEAEE